jgi:putative ABC transport system permease protein
MRHADLGMSIDQTLVIRSPHLRISDSLYNSTFQSLVTELERKPEVKIISCSSSLPGLSLNELSSTTFVKLGEDTKKSYEYYFFGIDAEFISAMDMKIVAGRNFEKGLANDDQVIINEEAASKLGFSKPDEAIGAKITFQTRWPGEPSTIIGVIKNFYQRSPKEKHIPMLFHYASRTNYFSIKLKSENIHETIAGIQATYNQVFPNAVFNYFFLDEKFNQQYKADAQFGQVIATLSSLAIFIACLGLFGLSSYTIVQRTKEIGIRKVLGASVMQIVGLLSQDFIKVVLMAALAALPIAYWAISEWLSNYEVKISLNVWVFLIPVMMILLLAMATVSFQTFKTAISNPTESLRQE